ncbi:carbohydrate ABC transporter permease [Marinactinospora thermotolerans]|uniref:Carbohydrate ABC transporter membrane protein 1, CUT1 family (TC 3.A.1.1.-) n=1 Tax=Marinactinospora thermotolerans DSM 45154 TaxID=1122192 RepID=A0A1T4LQV5_9ACTN|nr:sugar ABC transporter permease [Marinactinospora thermotolerans]SJZ57122.1 carbohydrate ABC transporter membrane protein 1, CUT1 family (TC 3.A.1.1.-) [Marinactinospora thermotolerans DSM 45154]
MTPSTDIAPPEAARAVSPAPPGGRARTRHVSSWAGLWFVLPFTVLFAVFLVWPMLAGLWTSFTDRSLGRAGSSFVGLANWSEMLGDPAVWQSLWVTLLFTLISTPPLVLIALGMALLTHRVSRLGWFLRFSFFAPFLLPVAVVTLIWTWLYQPGFGMVNGALQAVGLPEVNWLTDKDTVLVAIAITTVWWTVGFNFLLYLAALQGIPAYVYEAAALDGVNPWQRFRHITLPLLHRTTALIVTLQLVASLKLFDQAYLMTAGAGGPDYAARPIIGYIFDSGFTGLRIGYASAISYLLFAVIVVVSLVQFRLFSGKGKSA